MPSHASDVGRWIRKYSQCPEGAPQLICFPHAGGSATSYLAFSQALRPAVQVAAVQYPGRQERQHEPHFLSITALAEQIAAVLRESVAPPFSFFGHSMGAVVAFEVARRLQQTGDSPQWLFASGRRAPSRKRPPLIFDDSDVVSQLRLLGGTDPRFLRDKELLATILPVVRHDYLAVERYEWLPGTPLTCPITALIGDSDPHSTVEEASAWAEHSTGPFDLCVFSGGHFFLDAHSAAVTRTILAALGSAPAIDSLDEVSP